MRWFAASGGLRAWRGCLRGRRVTSGVMEMTARAGKGCSYGVDEGAVRFFGELQGDGVPLRATRNERLQEMCRNVASVKGHTKKVGKACVRRKRRRTAASARPLVRNSGGLEAWRGAGSGGNGRRTSRLFYRSREGKNRAFKTRINARRRSPP